MADPVTLGTLALVSTAAGGATSAFGAIQGGYASSRMYQYQASVADFNRKVALQDAEYATAEGEVKAQQEGMKVRAQEGEIVAQQGARGLDVHSGSAKAVQTSAKEVGEEDIALIRNDAARRAWGYQVEAAGFKAQASVDTAAASNEVEAGYLKGLTSVLGSAGSVSSKWLQGQQYGLWGT